MIEFDWEGIENILDKFPEGVVINGETKVSIPNTDICKMAFACTKQDDEYYYMITDVITIDDIINSTIRLKLTNMLMYYVKKELDGIISNNPIDCTKEKEALAKVILLLDEFNNEQ
jgi:hypothetical protein